MKCPSLETADVKIEPITLADVTQKYVDWLNDPVVNQGLNISSTQTLQSVSEYVANKVANDVWFWKIIAKDSNVHVGNVKIDPIDWQSGVGWFGIMIGDKNYWGKGIGTQATQLSLKASFEIAGLTKVYLGVLKTHAAAIKVYEKSGFRAVDSIPSTYKMHSKTLYMLTEDWRTS